MVFLFVFFWDSYDSTVRAFNTVLEVSGIVLIFLNSFFFLPFWFIYFYHSIFYFTNPIFCLRYSTICCLQSAFWSHLLHYSLYIDSFISSRSLLNLSCIFQSLSPGYLSVIPFWFQDFGSFSLSLFGIIYQVDSLSLPLLFGLVSCSFTWWVFLSLHLVYIAVFGVAFLYSGSLWSSLYCGVSCFGWGCISGLSRFLG